MKYIKVKKPKINKRMHVLEGYVQEIKKELESYSIELIEEFKTLFPDTRFPQPRTVILKGRSVGATTMTAAMELFNRYYSTGDSDFVPRVTMNDICTFWSNWNRFKKLKAFL